MDSGSGAPRHPGMTDKSDRISCGSPFFSAAPTRSAWSRWQPPRPCARRYPKPICGSGMSTTPCMKRIMRTLLKHSRPFEDAFKAPTPSLGRIEQALDRAGAENRVLVLGLHGSMAEDGELQAMCEVRNIAFTGSGSASSHLAFDKVAAKRFAAIAGVKAPPGVMLQDIEAGARRIWQADRKAGARRLELRSDLRQFEAGHRRRPQRCEIGGISDRAVHRGRRSHLRRAGAIGRLGVFAAADRDRTGARACSTTRPNICSSRRRRFARGAFHPR